MEKTREHLKLIILLGIPGINRKSQDLNETKPQVSAVYKRGEYKGNKGNSSKRSCVGSTAGSSRESRDAQPAGLSFQRKRCRTCSSTQKAGNWSVTGSGCSNQLSVGSGDLNSGPILFFKLQSRVDFVPFSKSQLYTSEDSNSQLTST